MAKASTKTAAAEGSTATAAAPAEASTGWGSPPASGPEAAAGNGGGSTEPAVVESKDVPQTQPAEGVSAPVENADPAEGQGRVVSPSDTVIPADAPTGAAEQAQPNTPEHHDATNAGTGGGGDAETVEQAERTGAPIGDNTDPEHVEITDVTGRVVTGNNPLPGYDPNNPDAFSGEGSTVAAPTLEIVSEPPSINELLQASFAVDAAVANARQEAAARPKEGFVPPKPLTEPIDFEPHPNEKLTDAVGSTHDASGRPIVGSYDNPDPDGPGVPVYVGTAQPVANPDAGWRSNA